MSQINFTSHTQHKHPKFICPYCLSPLIPNAKTWQCDGSKNPKNTQHPFDVARQGYVNLLPVQNKKSKDPGDSQDAIDARHRFLNKGYYQPLQQLVTKLIHPPKHAIENDKSPKTWLDIGCGEGYYTQRLSQPPTTQSESNIDNLVALDISKPAVALFAKTAKQNQQLWLQQELQTQQTGRVRVFPIVASAAKLPLADKSIDGISSIFSPILPDEFARVLRQGGRLIIAKPDVGHLQSIREALFDEVRPHDSDKFLDTLEPYFNLVNTYRVQAELLLDTKALANLLTMTPYSYRAKADKRKALLESSQSDEFETQAKFVVYELVRV